VCACRGPPCAARGGPRVPLAGGGTDVPMLPVVCLCVGLLWLPRRVAAGVVVAALTPGLAVLFALALATRWG